MGGWVVDNYLENNATSWLHLGVVGVVVRSRIKAKTQFNLTTGSELELSLAIFLTGHAEISFTLPY